MLLTNFILIVDVLKVVKSRECMLFLLILIIDFPFFSLNPSRHRPHPFHRTAFTDTGLLNGFFLVFALTF